jgi:NADH:ubiquinone oxidoreductase subunit E
MLKYSMHLLVCGGTGCFGFCEKGPISICTGTACYVRGAETVLSEFKKQLDIEVGDRTYGRVAPDDVQAIIEEYTT